MRKILITLIAILLLVGVAWVIYGGINIGPIKIDGIKNISQKSDELDATIKYVSTEINSNDNASRMKKLDEAYKKLITAKEKYEKIAMDENGNSIAEVQEYEIEYLWNQLGNYAKKEGVKVNLEFPVNNSITKTHDIKFTITGSYISVTDFLYLLEADTKLPFKVESFKLLPSAEDTLVATFTCKDVKINLEDFKETPTEGTIQTDEKEDITESSTKDEKTDNTTTNNTTANNTTTNNTTANNTTANNTTANNTTTNSTSKNNTTNTNR